MLAGVALWAVYTTVFFMNHILVDQIKLLSLPEALTHANRTWLSPVKLYPDLQLFIGWTHQAQNLEGQILKKVMLQSVDEGIVCLPIHDAVALPQRHQAWAEQAMLNAWTDAVGCNVKPRVKVDMAT